MSAPTIDSIVPNTGQTVGGIPILINGTNFSNPVTVTIGGNVSISSSAITNILITTLLPPGTDGIKDVTVATNSGSVTNPNSFTYFTLTIDSIVPPTGPNAGGIPISINGTNFIGVYYVNIGTNNVMAGSFTQSTSTLIEFTLPLNTTCGLKDITIVTIYGSVTKPNAFQYIDTPVITSINPPNGPSLGGTPVTISGSCFSNITSVTIGGNPATNILVSIDTTTITCITPPGTGTSIVEVIGVGGIGVLTFTYDPPVPTVTSINPPSGPLIGGTPITIIGTGFINVTSVTIDGTTATSIFVSPDNTTITATTPAATTGTGPQTVLITAVGGTVTTTYTYFTPIITSVYPTRGPTAGGTQITLTGNYFAVSNPTSITIGGISVGFTVVSNTKIIVTTPATIPPGTPGTQNIIVTFDSNINITASIPFTYDDTPIITLINPNGGPEEGGTQITITGTSFGSTTTVTIGGILVIPISISPDNATIICITPPGIGRQPVVVTTTGGSATSYFTYLPPLPPPPYGEQICVEPPYNATNFTSANSAVLSTLQSYAKNSPNYPWDTGTDAQQIYRSQQNTSYFNTLNQKTDVIKTANNVRIANGLPGNMPYPPFKSQAERLMYIQGLNLTSARNKITGENPSAPAGVPCTTIYEIINS